MTIGEMGSDLDKYCTLAGDEDTGVGIECRLCDSGGQPVAYYGWDNAYSKVPEVLHVRTVSGLVGAAVQHLRAVHGLSNKIELTKDPQADTYVENLEER